METSVRLNQVTAWLAKQMCRAELAKAFSHYLLEVGIARCEPHTPSRHRANLLPVILRGG